MCDETVIVKGTGTIFLGGPPLVKAATGEDVTAEDLGGGERPRPPFGRRGPRSARRRARAGARPVDRREPQPAAARTAVGSPRARAAGGRPGGGPKAGRPVRRDPADPRRPLAVREIIARLVDGSRFHEFKPLYGETLVTGFAHLEGWPVGDHRQRRHPVQPVGPQGRPLHRARRAAPDPARVPPEHHRVHGRPRVRGGRHRQGRREDGHRRRVRRGAQVHGHRRRLVRRRELRDGRAGVPAALPVDVAECPDQRHGRPARRHGCCRRSAASSPPMRNATPSRRRSSRPTSAKARRTSRRRGSGTTGSSTRSTRAGSSRMGLDAALHAPIPETRFGVFRNVSRWRDIRSRDAAEARLPLLRDETSVRLRERLTDEGYRRVAELLEGRPDVALWVDDLGEDLAFLRWFPDLRRLLARSLGLRGRSRASRRPRGSKSWSSGDTLRPLSLAPIAGLARLSALCMSTARGDTPRSSASSPASRPWRSGRSTWSCSCR